MKKYLPLIGIAFTVILIFFLFWFFFLRTSDSTNQTGRTDSSGGFGTFFDSENTQVRNFQESLNDLPPNAFVQNSRIPILRQLSYEPIAGYTFFQRDFEVENNDLATTTGDTIPETETEDRHVFRFMERATGHVYETNEKTLSVEKITNTTIQKVVNAIFSANGSKVLFEKLSEEGESVDSYLGEIVTEIEEGGAEERILQIQPYSILSSFFTLSPSEDSFAYLTRNQESGNLYVGDFDSEEEIVFQSPIREWLVSWDSENLISMTTKPSANIPGYGYLLNTSNGSIEKIFNQIDGLTFKTSPDTNSALYSQSQNGSFFLKNRNLESGEDRDFPLKTFPEKCTFSNVESNTVYCGAPTTLPSANYPDDWYKGKVSFNDRLWKIDLSTGGSETVYNFSTSDYGSFDIIDIEVTEGDKFILFKNKRDLSLWSLDLDAMDNSDTFIDDSPADL